jgi:hypothetical protein
VFGTPAAAYPNGISTKVDISGNALLIQSLSSFRNNPGAGVAVITQCTKHDTYDMYVDDNPNPIVLQFGNGNPFSTFSGTGASAGSGYEIKRELSGFRFFSPFSFSCLRFDLWSGWGAGGASALQVVAFSNPIAFLGINPGY